MTGVLKACALVTIVTLGAGTHVPPLGALTGHPRLAWVGIAQIHHHLENINKNKICEEDSENQ